MSDSTTSTSVSASPMHTNPLSVGAWNRLSVPPHLAICWTIDCFSSSTACIVASALVDDFARRWQEELDVRIFDVSAVLLVLHKCGS